MPMATASGNASSSDTVKATGGPTPLHTDLGCTIDWLRPGRTAPDMCVLSGAVCCVVVTENWVRAREHVRRAFSYVPSRVRCDRVWGSGQNRPAMRGPKSCHSKPYNTVLHLISNPVI